MPIAPCASFNSVFEDEHLHANGLWWESEHPKWGRIRQTGAVVHWERLSMNLPRRAPLLGEHTFECLRELGVDDARIERLSSAGAIVQLAEDP